MKNFVHICLIFLLLSPIRLCANDYYYILNDKCINDLYNMSIEDFAGTGIESIKDSRGLMLRYVFEDLVKEYYNPDIKTYKLIEDFLAKIENPVIIEVHVKNLLDDKFISLKNWEISTIMANNIEVTITRPLGRVDQSRINSVGYGEFLPAKNTPNNGSKFLNRVDIIILCNISGE